EDTPLNVVCLRDFLEARGCRVEVAENGASAVDKTVLLHPDAILMDIQMPVLDGIQATRRIRRLADPALARTPIIAVTALAMPGDREQCEQAGADDYLAKPYSLVVLHERLLSLVAKSRAPA
ncbi:MAG TPA: response regulator, partial [Rariglobus sp.]